MSSASFKTHFSLKLTLLAFAIGAVYVVAQLLWAKHLHVTKAFLTYTTDEQCLAVVPQSVENPNKLLFISCGGYLL